MIKGETVANAKSPLDLMTLGATQGDNLIIRAGGEDEQAAADALVEPLSKG